MIAKANWVHSICKDILLNLLFLSYFGSQTTPKAKRDHHAHFMVDKPNIKESNNPSQSILKVDPLTYPVIFISGWNIINLLGIICFLSKIQIPHLAFHFQCPDYTLLCKIMCICDVKVDPTFIKEWRGLSGAGKQIRRGTEGWGEQGQSTL